MATATSSPLRRDMESVTRPDPHKNAAQILCWILFWPWNLAWSICVNNPFPYLGKSIFTLIRSTFEEISSGEFKQIGAELSLDTEMPTVPKYERQLYIAPAVVSQPSFHFDRQEPVSAPQAVSDVPDPVLDVKPATRQQTEPALTRIPQRPTRSDPWFAKSDSN